jgi:hypothetical protein
MQADSDAILCPRVADVSAKIKLGIVPNRDRLSNSSRKFAALPNAIPSVASGKLRRWDRGWPGDVLRFRYDISRLQALGWRPQRHSTEAVRHAVERILANGF